MEVSIQIEREDTRIKDLLLKRYGGGARDVFSMPFFDGYELIRYAQDADVEDRLFLRWSIWYQSQMGFQEFKDSMTIPQYQTQGGVDNRTSEKILKDVKAIIG